MSSSSASKKPWLQDFTTEDLGSIIVETMIHNKQPWAARAIVQLRGTAPMFKKHADGVFGKWLTTVNNIKREATEAYSERDAKYIEWFRGRSGATPHAVTQRLMNDTIDLEKLAVKESQRFQDALESLMGPHASEVRKSLWSPSYGNHKDWYSTRQPHSWNHDIHKDLAGYKRVMRIDAPILSCMILNKCSVCAGNGITHYLDGFNGYAKIQDFSTPDKDRAGVQHRVAIFGAYTCVHSECVQIERGAKPLTASKRGEDRFAAVDLAERMFQMAGVSSFDYCHIAEALQVAGATRPPWVEKNGTRKAPPDNKMEHCRLGVECLWLTSHKYRLAPYTLQSMLRLDDNKMKYIAKSVKARNKWKREEEQRRVEQRKQLLADELAIYFQTVSKMPFNSMEDFEECPRMRMLLRRMINEGARQRASKERPDEVQRLFDIPGICDLLAIAEYSFTDVANFNKEWSQMASGAAYEWFTCSWVAPYLAQNYGKNKLWPLIDAKMWRSNMPRDDGQLLQSCVMALHLFDKIRPENVVVNEDKMTIGIQWGPWSTQQFEVPLTKMNMSWPTYNERNEAIKAFLHAAKITTEMPTLMSSVSLGRGISYFTHRPRPEQLVGKSSEATRYRWQKDGAKQMMNYLGAMAKLLFAQRCTRAMGAHVLGFTPSLAARFAESGKVPRDAKNFLSDIESKKRARG